MKMTVSLIILLLIGVRLSVYRSDLHRSQGLCRSLLSPRSAGISIAFSGSPQWGPEGQGILADAIWEVDGRSIPFSGDVILEFPVRGMELGQRVLVSGRFRCVVERRNPGAIDDGLLTFRKPRVRGVGNSLRVKLLSRPVSWLSHVRERFLSFLQQTFHAFPGLTAFEWALWTGDASRLPESLREFYREGGILQILALSGQHVLGMTLLVNLLVNGTALLWSRTTAKSRGDGVHWVRFFAPLLCAFVLWTTSWGAPTMARTLGLVIAHTLLRIRRFEVPVVQKVCTSVAGQILWEPALIASPSYLLSGAITALVAHVMFLNSEAARWKSYLRTATLSPILVAPLTAFFFSKVAWSAPVNNLLLAWVWDLFLIPMGFFLPFLLGVLPAPGALWLGNILERGWSFFVEGHAYFQSWVGSTQTSVVRPSWLELLALETCLGVALWICFGASKRPKSFL